MDNRAPEPPILEEEPEKLVARLRERARARQFSSLKPEELAWLALPPGWPVPLAEACRSFPVPANGIANFLARAEAAALCEREIVSDVKGRTVERFWMPEAMRPEVMDYLKQQRGAEFLEQTAVTIGQDVLTAAKEGVSVLPMIAQWAELAVKTSKGLPDAGRWLKEQVRGGLDRKDMGDAVSWVRTGTLLAGVLRGALDTSVRIGAQQVEYAYQVAQDERKLDGFLERDEQKRAFRRLLDGSDDITTLRPKGPLPTDQNEWALHYLGVGGVGKTTLLRFLQARYAVWHNVLVVRLDFDHLSPSYPARRPGQLLLEFADRLRLQNESQGFDSLLGTLRLLVDELHASIEGTAGATNVTARPQFAGACRAFIALILQSSNPVLLVLDTCEELTKLQPAGARLPAIETTFALLEAIHQGAKGWVRVIFAGRRLLALKGLGWNAAKGASAEDHAALPADIPYMVLHKIRGFTREEADTYVRQIPDLALDNRLRDAIFAKSTESSAGPKIEHEGVVDDDATLRFNPFDLKLYTDWAREDPDLSEAIIASGALDPYVEVRILQRLRESHLRDVIPGIVLLRQFDRAMLAPLIADSSADAEQIYRDLGNQEWIDYRVEGESKDSFLDVNPMLRIRIEHYFEDRDRAHLLEEAKQRLLPILAALIEGKPLEELKVVHLDAALRLLPAKQAATIWDDIALRFPGTVGWGWAQEVAARLLGEDNAVGDKAHRLRAGVQAVFISGMLHRDPNADRTPHWKEVEETAARYPVELTGLWLAERARLGQMAAIRVDIGDRFVSLLPVAGRRFVPPNPPAVIDPKTFLDRVVSRPGIDDRLSAPLAGLSREQSEELVAANVAAADALLDLHTVGGFDGMRPEWEAISEWITILAERMPEKPWDLQSYLLTTVARLSVQNHLESEAVPVSQKNFRPLGIPESRINRLVSRLVSLVNTYDPFESLIRQRKWADWQAPASPRSYFDLCIATLQAVAPPEPDISARPTAESGGIGPLLEESPSIRAAFLKRELDSFAPFEDIDSERDASILLQIALTRGPVDAELLGKTEDRERYIQARQPYRPFHNVAPPLVVSLAMGWLALGRGDRALEMLDRRRDEVPTTDPLTLIEIQRARITVIRRCRFDEQAREFSALSTTTEWLWQETVSLRALCITASSASDNWIPVFDSARMFRESHAGWQSHPVLTPKQAAKAVIATNTFRLESTSFDVSSQPDVVELDLRLDLEEARQLATLHHLPHDPLADPSSAIGFEFDPEEWLTQGHATEADHAARIALRAEALGLQEADNGKWKPWLGSRRLAEIALEEGELLALRLPAAAMTLLRRAKGWYHDADDPVGETIASILLLITTLRTGKSTESKDELRVEVRSAYERLLRKGVVLDLPEWADVEEAVGASSPETLTLTEHPSWRYWLRRLITALVYLKGPTEGDRWIRHQAWLQERYGETPPIELDYSSVEREPPPPPRSPTRYDRIVNILRGVGILIAVIGFYGFLAYGIGKAIQKSLGLSASLSLFSNIGIGFLGLFALIGLIVVPVVFYLIFLNGVIASLLASRSLVKASIRPRANREDIEQTVHNFAHVIEAHVEIERREWTLGVAWPFLKLGNPRTISARAFTPGLRPHTEAAKDIPEALTFGLMGLRRALAVHLAPIALEVDPNLAQCAWEAALALATPLLPWKGPPLLKYLRVAEPLGFYRHGDPLPGSAESEFSWTGGAHLLVGERWQSVVREWSPLTGLMISHSVGEFLESIRDTTGGKVLHLIAQPVYSASDGYRLQLQGTDQKSASVSDRALSGFSDVAYLSRSRLPLDRFALVIVQDEPAEEPFPRTDSDRERAARLRAYSAEVFNAGARCVLMIPSLNPDDAEQVIETIARRIQNMRRPPDARMLLQLADQIRAVIREKVVHDARDSVLRQSLAENGRAVMLPRYEAALDVTVFARRVPETTLRQFRDSLFRGLSLPGIPR